MDEVGSSYFFVLSGFVVAMLAEQKTAAEFARDRAVRIYLVALPVLVFTFLLSVLFPTIGPSEHSDAIQSPLLTYGLSAVFLNESWSLSLFPYLDGPYWSLSYEVMYYLIFASGYYSTGVLQKVATISAVLIAGPKVLALLPCWLAGVAAYKMRSKLNVSKRTGWLIWAGAPALLVLLLGTGVKAFANSFDYFNGTTSEGYVRSWCVALAVAINIWAACQIDFRFPNLVVVAATKFAGSSFSLYLIHLPLLYVLASIAPDRHSLGFVCGAIPIILLASHGFAMITEGKRKAVIQFIERIVRARAAHA